MNVIIALVNTVIILHVKGLSMEKKMFFSLVVRAGPVPPARVEQVKEVLCGAVEDAKSSLECFWLCRGCRSW